MRQATRFRIDSAELSLRLGLAFVYGYAAVEMQVHPENFLKYVPSVVSSIIPLPGFIIAFGLFELVLTLWLLSGKYMQYAGFLSCVLMIAIIIPNGAYFPVLFRNVAIAFASFALVALHDPS